MRDLAEILSIRVRQLRHARNWTQEDLADKVGISTRYVGYIERCEGSATVTILGRLAEAFAVEPGELLRLQLSRKTKDSRDG
jgi:transcriptional regulator with XRE-family HTH domain